MLHHEKHPEKPQYNMTTPPFLDQAPPPPSSIRFVKLEPPPPPISISFDKLEPPPPLYGGVGGCVWGGGSNFLYSLTNFIQDYLKNKNYLITFSFN